jgi:CDP-diacylglycerol--glycerol-3-phosphate 3-phosphatidyltransferase
MTFWRTLFKNNFANTLTVWRIVLAFIVMLFLLRTDLSASICALIFFLAALATDFFDGWVARRWGTVSDAGKLLDPLADKVLVIAILFVFAKLKLVPLWALLVIVIRELLITAVRAYASGRHVIIAAGTQGKYKAVSQYVLIAVLLCYRVLGYLVARQGGSISAYFTRYGAYAIDACVVVTVILTISSGASYLYENRRLFAK